MITKTCTTCNVSKATDQFSKDKNTRDGLRNNCKACNKARSAAYNAEHRNERAAHHAEHREQDNARSAVYGQSPKGRFAKYKAGAKSRAISFDLSFDEFMSFWQANCFYCGDQIATIGLDRVDSSLGYTVDNVVPCCRMCNIIKLDHDHDILNTHMLKMLKHQRIV